MSIEVGRIGALGQKIPIQGAVSVGNYLRKE